MKVLIGYNGSDASRAAIEELSSIGLTHGSEIQLVVIAEPWMQPKTEEDALALSENGLAEVRSRVTDAVCSGVSAKGAPARELLAAAEKFRPDLIILGAHGSDVEGSRYLGQTARTVMNEAACSVRIARRGKECRDTCPKMLVAYDGSRGSVLAVDSIVKRNWPEGTQVRLLAVADASVMNSIGRFSPQMTNVAVESRLAQQWAETLAATCLARLRKANLRAAVEIRIGVPKTMIVDEAIRWEADCIFVAPHCGLDSYERYLLGSVSAAVAERAGCSVEVVR